MKKIHLILTVLFMTSFYSFKASAQEKNFFLGEWEVIVVGTPNGDSKMLVHLEENEGKLSGFIADPVTKKETAKFTNIEAKKETITLYFTAQGFEAYLFLEKKDQDNVTGSLMDMFDATGIRVKK